MSMLTAPAEGFDLSANARAPLADWAPPLRGLPFEDRGRGPHGFDCTGVMEFVQALLGRPIKAYAEHYSAAHVDAEQTAAFDRLIQSELAAYAPGAGEVGDILILGSGGRAHHVAVLCGAGHLIHARPGAGVSIEPIEGRKRVRRAARLWLYNVLRPAP